MIVNPKVKKDRSDIKLRLGVKSSMPNISGLFAAIFSFFKIRETSKIVYSKEILLPNERTGIELNENYKQSLIQFYQNQIDNSNLNEEDFIEHFNKLPLFDKQIEPLQVVLQLFWRIANIDLETPPNNRERGGRARFNKTLRFSVNMDILDAALSENDQSISLHNKNLLFNWICKTNLPIDSASNKKISKILTAFSESTFFKIRTEDDQIIFQQEGIYSELSNDNLVRSSDTKEDVGPFRVLNNFIKEGLHYYLDENIQGGFKLRNDIPKDELENYLSRVNSFLNLNPKTTHIEIIEEPDIPSSAALSKINKIFYGAPGTGKSHKVGGIVQGKDERTERVTFHPEYDYASFVGGYKPTMVGEDIRYEFVPQAFTNIYVKAWNDLDNDYYLVIEEINRGNCAEIFGDIFQLLDRTNNYKITPSKELEEYLAEKLSGNTNIDSKKLLLPENLNILATMNTSDQSLFPMDSAFKRRWDWEYIPINYDNTDDNLSSKFKVRISDGEFFSWLSFIKAVNSLIKSNDNLGMDKCLGNYFIKPESDIIDIKTFINKAIFYLWNDVFKDEIETDSIFKNKTTYEDFFPIQPNGINKVKEILEILKINRITAE